MNDVYQLDNLPRVKSFIDAHRTPNTLVTMPGDFLMPSFLSAIDHGHAMVDMLNAVGLDFVCIGNHEADVKLSELHERYKESNFKWINTNMPGLPLPEGVPPMPTVERVELPGGKSVALLGILTDETSLYKKGSFGDAEIEDPTTCVARELESLSDVDSVILMTHLRIKDDRALARSVSGGKQVHLMLGAHDHDPYHEQIDGVTVLKVGMDATHMGVCDMTWPAEEGSAPELKVEVFAMSDWPEDPKLLKMVEGHMHLLEVLKEVWLFQVGPDGISSKNGRVQQSSVGTVLTSQIRNAFKCDCCLWLAGAIRASADYAPNSFFTMENLQAELAFEDIAVAVQLPGLVISETIAYSRRFAFEEPPVADGCFLQHCGNIEFDDESRSVTAIGGEPLIPDKLYSIVLCPKLLDGLNNLVPLVTYWQTDHGQVYDEEYGMEAKQAIIQCCSAELWKRRLLPLFEHLDANHDGTLSRDEVAAWLRTDNPGKSDEAIEILLGQVKQAATRKGSAHLLEW